MLLSDKQWLREYKIGDIIWWRNCYGQSFSARVVRKHEGNLIVKRDSWFAEECLTPDSFVVSRRFPAKDIK